ncbi:hypothetical protein GCM10028824_01140 [Hymenobacter segetis]|uniref:Uncharacterized protein n=1 Tax=Hymenobacter segetis TaxID=2025509 RepID=A0ABU9LRW5_9BACT
MYFEYRSLGDFMDEILVVCPKCGSKGVVKTHYKEVWEAKFSCPNCSFYKIWDGNPNAFVTAHFNYEQYDGILFGPPVDCFFRYPLWYQVPCKDETLYAYNMNHLNWLKQYVEAKLRERTQTVHGWNNASLQSRLPKWMLSSKNRTAVLKRIAELERK